VIRLAVRVRREDAELALAELLALAPGGVEECDLGDRVEYAVYGAPGELPALPALRAAAGDALVEVVTSEVADDWEQRWRRFHRPVVVGGRLRVRPPWAAAQPGLTELVIDPGAAFGTGAHPTTRLCLELLLGLEPGGPAVDLGCGSGVLAIAAARLGWAPVLAVDNDPAAVQATADNARANAVEVDVRRLDMRRQPAPECSGATLLLANLVGPLLLELAPRLLDPLPEALIAGGVLMREEADQVAGAFARRGLQAARRVDEGDWSALLLCDNRAAR
jgi:ribosomal protein L11 methyltransferase